MAIQNRFINFDKRLQPGAGFEEGLIFDHSSFHNIPGFPDNVRVRLPMSATLTKTHQWSSTVTSFTPTLITEKLHFMKPSNEQEYDY